MRALVWIFALVAIALAAGCGSDDDEGAGQTAAGGGQTVEISATDFDFAPAKIDVAQAGSVTFRLTNDGQAPHALEVEGEGVEEESDTIGAGESTELTVDLEAGEYELYCPVDGHKDLGMTAELLVSG